HMTNCPDKDCPMKDNSGKPVLETWVTMLKWETKEVK
ncbi:hypothetical protein LCGC14_3100670, partial [marine sediment metagenome]